MTEPEREFEPAPPRVFIGDPAGLGWRPLGRMAEPFDIGPMPMLPKLEDITRGLTQVRGHDHMHFEVSMPTDGTRLRELLFARDEAPMLHQVHAAGRVRVRHPAWPAPVGKRGTLTRAEHAGRRRVATALRRRARRRGVPATRLVGWERFVPAARVRIDGDEITFTTRGVR